jgi:hypothetical protein
MPDVGHAIRAVREVSGYEDVPVVVGGGQLMQGQGQSIRELGGIPAIDDGLEAVLALGDVLGTEVGRGR